MNSKKLTELRKSKQWTREEAALILGVSKFTYRSYEQELREPRIQVLRDMAIKFECKVDDLI